MTSPRRPIPRVRVAIVRRYPSATHWIVLKVVSSSSTRVGKATLTIDASMVASRIPTETVARTYHFAL